VKASSYEAYSTESCLIIMTDERAEHLRERLVKHFSADLRFTIHVVQSDYETDGQRRLTMSARHWLETELSAKGVWERLETKSEKQFIDRS